MYSFTVLVLLSFLTQTHAEGLNSARSSCSAAAPRRLMAKAAATKNACKGMSAVWFRKGLRLHDNAPLVRACELGQVLPIFILDPHFVNPKRIGQGKLLKPRMARKNFRKHVF